MIQTDWISEVKVDAKAKAKKAAKTVTPLPACPKHVCRSHVVKKRRKQRKKETKLVNRQSRQHRQTDRQTDEKVSKQVRLPTIETAQMMYPYNTSLRTASAFISSSVCLWVYITPYHFITVPSFPPHYPTSPRRPSAACKLTQIPPPIEQNQNHQPSQDKRKLANPSEPCKRTLPPI